MPNACKSMTANWHDLPTEKVRFTKDVNTRHITRFCEIHKSCCVINRQPKTMHKAWKACWIPRRCTPNGFDCRANLHVLLTSVACDYTKKEPDTPCATAME